MRESFSSDSGITSSTNKESPVRLITNQGLKLRGNNIRHRLTNKMDGFTGIEGRMDRRLNKAWTWRQISEKDAWVSPDQIASGFLGLSDNFSCWPMRIEEKNYDVNHIWLQSNQRYSYTYKNSRVDSKDSRVGQRFRVHIINFIERKLILWCTTAASN